MAFYQEEGDVLIRRNVLDENSIVFDFDRRNSKATVELRSIQPLLADDCLPEISGD